MWAEWRMTPESANKRHILPHLQNAWIGADADYILAEQKVENIKNK